MPVGLRVAVRTVALSSLVAIATLALSGFLDVAAAQSSDLTTATTLPPPGSSQTTVVFDRNSNVFTGVVVADGFQPGSEALAQNASTSVPATSLITFYLRLAPSLTPVQCYPHQTVEAKALLGTATTFEVSCHTPSIPPLFGPTLQIATTTSLSTFLAVTIRDETAGAVAEWLPFGVGALLAVACLFWASVKSFRGRTHRPPLRGWLRLSVLADVAWTASDSWATTVGPSVRS